MHGTRLGAWIVLSFLLSMLVSCGDGGSSSSNGRGRTGTVSLSLTDATIDGVQAVYVTIEKVSVHRDKGGRWEVIAEPHQTYNLLELVDGVREDLGIAVLETGHYTQLRMKLKEQPDNGINILSESHPYGNYVIDNSDEYTKLKIPSGYQTGVKVVCGFDINENQTTELILDFDASRSIVEAGRSKNLLLKPTIKVLEVDEYSIISGTVTEEGTTVGLENVLVSVQVYNSVATDAEDRVIVQASTRTDANGSYAIFVEPGSYSIVAYKDEYSPVCEELVAESDTSYTLNSELVSADTGTISGAVAITGGSDEQHATISFRQSTVCEGTNVPKEIELKSINVIKDGDYSERLPKGDYIVVASTYGKTTQVASPTIMAGDEILLSFTFDF